MPCEQISPADDPRRDDAPEAAPETLPVLDFQAIHDVEDRPIRAVPVPEWKGVVHVRSISALERDRWEIFLLSHRDDKTNRLEPCNLRATLVALCACDAAGERLFADDDADWLSKKSGAALDRLYGAAKDLNKVSDSDVEELKKTSDVTATC